MSNDPQDQYGGDYFTERPGEAPGYYPDGAAFGDPREAVRGRVQPAGICLIVVAAINMLAVLYLLFNAVTATLIPAQQLYEQQMSAAEKLAESFPMFKQFLKDKTPEDVKNQAMLVNWPWALVSLLGTLLTLLGGIGMCRLRWYGLSVAGAIFAALPCISCMGCCGVGEGIGIWALVVLLSEEVRAAFH